GNHQLLASDMPLMVAQFLKWWMAVLAMLLPHRALLQLVPCWWSWPPVGHCAGG
ncbi:hypothetical protein HaLaN_21079, partial [Haematococcus lacustris]